MLRKNTGSAPTVQRLCLHGLEALSLGIRASELWGGVQYARGVGEVCARYKDNILGGRYRTVWWAYIYHGGCIYLARWLYMLNTVAI